MIKNVARVLFGKKRKIQRQKPEESWHQRTTEATALRGHFIALLWSSEVHRTQFHHNNGKEGRRDKRGLSLLLNPFTAGRSVAWGWANNSRPPQEKVMTNSELQLIHLLPGNSFLPLSLSHTPCCYLHYKNHIGTRAPSVNEQMESAAFPDQEEAIGSFTSALKPTAASSLCLTTSAPPFPSLPVSLPVSLSSPGNMDGLLHICKWITLFVEIFFFVRVWIVKKKKKKKERRRGCERERVLLPSHCFLFFSL